MTISPPDELLGVQRPQLLLLPHDVHSHAAAEEAAEFSDAVGMTLDESQRFTLQAGLGERADGSWSAFEVADVEPRQNGKGDTIQAREATGLFLFGEQLQIHTSHEFPTSNEAFLRMVTLIESNRDLEKHIARIRFANGEQGIELKSGARLKYRARTGGAGRGFAGADLVVLDEAFALRQEHLAALLPTLTVNPNPQVWYASSAGMATSTALWALRKRALRGDPGRLAYCEHTAEDVSLNDKGVVESRPIDQSDRRLWAVANPALGRTPGISMEFLEAAYDALSDSDAFAREHLGVWDPLPPEEGRDPKLPADLWAATVTARPPALGRGEIVISFDVSLDSGWASIAVAAGSIDAPYVEVVEHNKETGWLPGRLVELVRDWDPIAIGCNGAGPAGAMVGPVLSALVGAGFKMDLLHQLSATEYKQACGGFYADVVEGRLSRQADQGPLDLAAEDAAERPLGDAWAWDLRSATVPISPLVAATIARALLPTEPPKYDPLASVL